jgi:hypothetical protein
MRREICSIEPRVQACDPPGAVCLGFCRWQGRLREDPRNFETLEELPGVMSDVVKAQAKLSDDYMMYMDEHIYSLEGRRK